MKLKISIYSLKANMYIKHEVVMVSEHENFNKHHINDFQETEKIALVSYFLTYLILNFLFPFEYMYVQVYMRVLC